jgi:hypothetical protein
MFGAATSVTSEYEKSRRGYDEYAKRGCNRDHVHIDLCSTAATAPQD